MFSLHRGHHMSTPQSLIHTGTFGLPSGDAASASAPHISTSTHRRASWLCSCCVKEKLTCHVCRTIATVTEWQAHTRMAITCYTNRPHTASNGKLRQAVILMYVSMLGGRPCSRGPCYLFHQLYMKWTYLCVGGYRARLQLAQAPHACHHIAELVQESGKTGRC